MSNANKSKVLVVVEGEKTDARLMENLFSFFPELSSKYQIIAYRTNIYTLYQEFFLRDTDPEDLDLIQVLKEHEQDPIKKAIFDDKYTDILLIFDLDPQDTHFSAEKIRQMQSYFTESSDMGKLYLNYPMVESFYHMQFIPDADYNERIVNMDELKAKKYKQRVNQESFRRNYRKFCTSRTDFTIVILQNINKVRWLLNEIDPSPNWKEIDFLGLLNHQLYCINEGFLYVVCTCVMYLYDYNHKLLYQT